MTKNLMNGHDGQPLLVYHGSYREIQAFRTERYEGVGGIYFTPEIDDAWSHASDSVMEDGDVATVMAVNLIMSNPYVATGIESHELSFARIFELEAFGFDGVIGKDTKGNVFEYVAFHPNQVVPVWTKSETQPAPGPVL